MSSLIFGNGSDIVHWQPSPTSRGTFDILSTCIVTLLLCVWTAVHQNIPPPGSFWTPKLMKIGWLILALLAPEMVAYTAWYVCSCAVWKFGGETSGSTCRHISCRLMNIRFQRQQALSVMRAVNKAYGLPNPPAWHERLNKAIQKAARNLKLMFKPRKLETKRVNQTY